MAKARSSRVARPPLLEPPPVGELLRGIAAKQRTSAGAHGVSKLPRLAGKPPLIWQELVHLMPSGALLFDGRGRVEQANAPACAALACEQPVGMSLKQLFGTCDLHSSDDRRVGVAAEVLRQAIRDQRTLQRQTIRYTTPNGEGRRLGLTVFPVIASGTGRTQPAGLVCLLTDLTAIHAAEEELQRRRSLIALGEMSAGIAHEFKNGLATISGYSQMLHAQLTGEARGQVAGILRQVTMLNEIATEFLVFARPMTVHPEPVDLGSLMRQCADGIRVQDFPEVRIHIEGEFPLITGDPVLLTAAISNLLRNSCEAIVQNRSGSRVTVLAENPKGNQARILIVDDGPGVTADVSEKIFIPFFTTKASGSGLGLPMVHKIITAHGGSVLLLDSAPGHTVFELLLPPAPARRAAAAPSQRPV